MSTIHQLIAAKARFRAQHVAVRHGDQQQTYEALMARSGAIASALSGIGAQGFVAVCIERGIDLPAALLGVLRAGAAYLPIDPAFPPQRIQAILEDSGASAILTSRSVSLPPTKIPQILLEDIEATDTAPVADAGGESAAYLIYTSGSTGKPKGVVVTHANVCNFLDSMAHEPGMTSSDVLLAVTTVSFDIAGLELLLPLYVGATVVIASRDDAMDGDRLKALIDTHRVNVMQATPATWRLLIGAEWTAKKGFRALCGGEPLPVDLAAQLLERGVELWNMYGPTETTIWSTVCQVTEARAPILIGRPIANTQCYVLDQDGRPCEAGAEGELFIGGAGVARGYYNRPELNAEKFLDDPFLPGARMYRTGDLARFHADGQLECLGRIDFQIKLRGFRIEPGEIEAALREHASVADAACGLRERAAGDARLIAWLQLRNGASLDEGALREQLSQRLPDYMVPQHFMAVPAIPRLLNGKLDRNALPDPFVGRAMRADTAAQPGTELERTIAKIWQDVLGTREPIGLNERFFERGGTSLLALQVLSKVRAIVGVRIPATKFFAAPTLSQFAQMLEREYSLDTPTKRATREDRTPLVPSAREAGVARDDIAIIGMSCRTPGAESLEQFWQMICEGREGIRDLSDADLDAAGVPAFERQQPSYVRRGGVLKNAYAFDAEFFGCSPREAELMDPQHRVMLECAWHALEDAGVPPGGSSRVGVYVGVAHNHYFDRAVANNPALRWGDSGFQTQLGADKDYAATRIAFKLNLRGPALALQTACSSSGVAVHLAIQGLRAGDCDAALVGGARINAPDGGYVHVDGGPQAVDGRVRPFDAKASGMVLASGAACLVLKTLAKAKADGDRIYAVIKGSAINNDGADKIAFTAPSEAGQLDVIRRALAVSGVDPATVGYVEAHGTGTHLGDPIEVAALAAGYESAERIALGSVKGNVGHLDAGAGAIGLIKAALALHHQVLPPSINCDEVNPECAFDRTPFFVNTALSPWPADSARRAAVSSFGFGGTNFHALLEEAPRPPPAAKASGASRALQVLQLSARSDAALQRQAKSLAAHLRAHPDVDLADVAYTLSAGRAHLSRRTAIVARDVEQAAKRLANVVSADSSAVESPSLVLMFPGQGAQYAGMGAQAWREEPVFRDCIDRCAEILQVRLGLDLRDLLYGTYPDADQRLKQTALAQPAIFAVSYATAMLWRSWGLKPAAMVGHSIGEFVAATLAGVFELEHALQLVAERGALMQSMPDGGMLAVRLSEAEVLAQLPPGVEIAGLNAPQLTVVSGPRAALAAFESALMEQRIGATMLRTSHAFHSSSMQKAADAFEKIVAQVPRQPAREPVMSTRTGNWIQPADMCDPSYWARQLREPVRFVDAARELLKTPGRVFLECGPGHNLCGAVRQAMQPGQSGAAIASLPGDAIAPALEHLLAAAGKLFVAGIALDPRHFHAGERRQKIGLPGYPFARTRYCLPIGAGESASMPAAASVPEPVAAPAAANEPDCDPMLGYVLGVFRELTGKVFVVAQAGVNFLELGLDSLLLMQVAARLKNDLKIEMRFRSLLEEHTSMRALADSLTGRGVSPPGSVQKAAAPAPQNVSMGSPVTTPPPDARIGRDRAGNPAWFVPDPARPGRYVQLEQRP